MPLAEDIIIRIALSGQDEVIAQFATMGQAGVGAFESIERAITGGSAVVGGLIAGIAGVGVGLLTWAEHAAVTTDRMGNLAAQSGTTIENITGLTQALSAAGANAEQLSFGFRRMAFTIESEWQRVVEEIKKGSTEAAQAQNKLVDAGFAVADAQERIWQAQNKLATLQAAAAGQPPPDPAVAQAHELANAYRDVQKAVQAEREAQLAQAEAARAALEQQRDSLEAVKAAIQGVISGTQTFNQASENANLNFQNVLKGLVANSGAAANAIENFGGDLTKLTGQAPTVEQFFYTLADFMKNNSNETLNSALALRLLGRGVSQDMIEAMKQGSGALKEHIEDLKRYGLVLSEDEKLLSRDFIRAFRSLSGELYTTFQQIGLLFGPAFTEGLNNLRAQLERSHGDIINWARGIADYAAPIIKGFFNLLATGDTGDKSLKWMQAIYDGLKKIGDYIKNTVGPMISGLFAAIGGTDVKDNPEVQKWKETFEAIGNVVSSAVTAVSTAVGKIVKTVSNALNEVRKLFEDVFGKELGDQIARGLEAALAGLVLIVGPRVLLSAVAMAAYKAAGITIGATVGAGVLTGIASVLTPAAIIAIVTGAVAATIKPQPAGQSEEFDKQLQEHRQRLKDIDAQNLPPEQKQAAVSAEMTRWINAVNDTQKALMTNTEAVNANTRAQTTGATTKETSKETSSEKDTARSTKETAENTKTMVTIIKGHEPGLGPTERKNVEVPKTDIEGNVIVKSSQETAEATKTMVTILKGHEPGFGPTERKSVEVPKTDAGGKALEDTAKSSQETAQATRTMVTLLESKGPTDVTKRQVEVPKTDAEGRALTPVPLPKPRPEEITPPAAPTAPMIAPDVIEKASSGLQTLAEQSEAAATHLEELRKIAFSKEPTESIYGSPQSLQPEEAPGVGRTRRQPGDISLEGPATLSGMDEKLREPFEKLLNWLGRAVRDFLISKPAWGAEAKGGGRGELLAQPEAKAAKPSEAVQEPDWVKELKASLKETPSWVDELKTVLGETTPDWIDTLQSAVDSLDAISWVSDFSDAVDSLQETPGWIDELDRLVQELQSLSIGGGGGGFQTGGLIEGPGTPTSDSILIRASHREYIMQNPSVEHYGVPFMHAVNERRLPKFNVGGLVETLDFGNPTSVPRFHSGGLVNHTFPELPRFNVGGLVETLNFGSAPRFNRGGPVDSNIGPEYPQFSLGGLVELSYSSLPQFNLGGLVETLNFGSAPRFNRGGIVDLTFSEPPRFNLGGLVELGYSSPRFNLGGLVELSYSSLPQFSLGGLVANLEARFPTLPRFANGGAVLAEARSTPAPTPDQAAQPTEVSASLHPVTIDLGKDEQGVERKVAGFYGTPRAVDQVSRYAVEQRISSIGRKPDWYGN